MAWMAETFEQRADPRALMRNAKSLIILGLNYGPKGDALAPLALKDCGAISVYARHRDYHDVVKGKLKELAAFLLAAARPEPVDVRVFVDTARLMEKRARRDRLAGQAHQSGLA
jgi:epoxyqueuosine reductase